MRLDQIVLSAYLAVRRMAARWHAPRPPLRIAGAMPVRDSLDEASALAALRELADVVLLLDDNSAAPFDGRGMCDEIVRIQNGLPWNDQANRTLLMYRAFVHGCDWVILADDDVAFSANFQTRADAGRVVAELEAAKREAYRFALRDLWESETRYRTDGIWGQKSFPVLRKNWFAYPGITLRDPALRLHTAAFPANLRIRQRIDDDHAAYHTGCMTLARRRARIERYRREDPENRFQRDYSYMLDESGLTLAEVPAEDVQVLRARLRQETICR